MQTFYCSHRHDPPTPIDGHSINDVLYFFTTVCHPNYDITPVWDKKVCLNVTCISSRARYLYNRTLTTTFIPSHHLTVSGLWVKDKSNTTFTLLSKGEGVKAKTPVFNSKNARVRARKHEAQHLRRCWWPNPMFHF